MAKLTRIAWLTIGVMDVDDVDYVDGEYNDHERTSIYLCG